jgi:hypothetical protein
MPLFKPCRGYSDGPWVYSWVKILGVATPGGITRRWHFQQQIQLFCCCHHFTLKHMKTPMEIWQGLNRMTCWKSSKIPGRYQAMIIPCTSQMMQGLDILTLFRGGYLLNRGTFPRQHKKVP